MASERQCRIVVFRLLHLSFSGCFLLALRWFGYNDSLTLDDDLMILKTKSSSSKRISEEEKITWATNLWWSYDALFCGSEYMNKPKSQQYSIDEARNETTQSSQSKNETKRFDELKFLIPKMTQKMHRISCAVIIILDECNGAATIFGNYSKSTMCIAERQKIWFFSLFFRWWYVIAILNDSQSHRP